MLFASHGDQIGLAKLVQGYRLSNSDGHYILTKGEGRKAIKLKVNEVVLQVISSSPLNNVCSSLLMFNDLSVTRLWGLNKTSNPSALTAMRTIASIAFLFLFFIQYVFPFFCPFWPLILLLTMDSVREPPNHSFMSQKLSLSHMV